MCAIAILLVLLIASVLLLGVSLLWITAVSLLWVAAILRILLLWLKGGCARAE